MPNSACDAIAKDAHLRRDVAVGFRGDRGTASRPTITTKPNSNITAKMSILRNCIACTVRHLSAVGVVFMMVDSRHVGAMDSFHDQAAGAAQRIFIEVRFRRGRSMGSH